MKKDIKITTKFHYLKMNTISEPTVDTRATICKHLPIFSSSCGTFSSLISPSFISILFLPDNTIVNADAVRKIPLYPQPSLIRSLLVILSI